MMTQRKALAQRRNQMTPLAKLRSAFIPADWVHPDAAAAIQEARRLWNARPYDDKAFLEAVRRCHELANKREAR